MTKEDLLHPSIVRKLLDYNQHTGVLTWKTRTEDLHPKRLNQWNAKFAGKPAFASVSAKGYKRGTIYNMSFYAHRVIFALIDGEWPTLYVDHINGDRCDNRIKNLRLVTPLENMRNFSKLHRHNTSGAIGVRYVQKRDHWIATIGFGGTAKYLGSFKTFDDAANARKAAEQSMWR